jgi:hypothetical protein
VSNINTPLRGHRLQVHRTAIDALIMQVCGAAHFGFSP